MRASAHNYIPVQLYSDALAVLNIVTRLACINAIAHNKQEGVSYISVTAVVRV